MKCQNTQIEDGRFKTYLPRKQTKLFRHSSLIYFVGELSSIISINNEVSTYSVVEFKAQNPKTIKISGNKFFKTTTLVLPGKCPPLDDGHHGILFSIETVFQQ